MWGAFLGGVAGMAKDIVSSEYQAMQTQRKERAHAQTHGFLYQVSDLETSFLCLYENCGHLKSTREKLDVAGRHLDKVAEVYTRLQQNDESTMSLAHVVAGHNKELGTIALREATRDMIRTNLKVNVNVVTSSRRSIEQHMDDMYKYIHTRSLVPKKTCKKRKRETASSSARD